MGFLFFIGVFALIVWISSIASKKAKQRQVRVKEIILPIIRSWYPKAEIVMDMNDAPSWKDYLIKSLKRQR